MVFSVNTRYDHNILSIQITYVMPVLIEANHFVQTTQGQPIPWLLADPETLLDQAQQTVWQGQLIDQSAEGDYLAQLHELL